MMWTLFLGAVKLTLLGLLVFYLVHVLITLRTEGTDYHLRFDRHDPAHSAGRILVWLGIRTAHAFLTALEASLNILEDASADVGEWLLHHRGS